MRSCFVILWLAASPAVAGSPPWFQHSPDSDFARDPGGWRGIAFADIDGDGDPDLAATRGEGVRLFRNDKGRMTAVAPAPPFVEQKGSAEAVALIDIDNDGDPDLFISRLEAPPSLYRNLGKWHFEPVADDLAGIGVSTHGGCFADFDGDSLLDVVIVTRDSADDLVFRNRNGSFSLVEGALAGSGGDGRSCAVADWNGDGRPDIFIANYIDRTGNRPRRDIGRLYLNEGGFRFSRVMAGQAVNTPSMTYGVTAVDWNEDGRADLSITNAGRYDRNELYENLPASPGTVDLYSRGAELGLGAVKLGPSKGQAWGDFDNDGDLDVYVAEGTEGLTPGDAPFDSNDELFERQEGRFVRRQNDGVDPGGALGAGVASADIDGDGDLDLVVANWGGERGEAPHLLINRAGGRSISLLLTGNRSNRQALGARADLIVRRGSSEIIRRQLLWPQTGYASMNEPVLHFGLQPADKVEDVVIHWPSGSSERYHLPSNQLRVRIEEGKGEKE